MRKAFCLGLVIVSLILTSFVTHNSIQLNSPSAYDLIAAVNDLRASNGLGALEVNGSLMASGKVQADYLSLTECIQIVNGHEGAGGTNAKDRASAAGYPISPGIDVKDCWACAGNSYSLNELFTNPQIWNDEAHLSLILHKYAKQVGAGVTEKDGSIYYDLVISFDWGTAPNNTDITPATLPTHSTTPQVVPVIVSTPKPDGSITHVVQPGQALWSIAISYGVTVEQLRLLNNFSSTATNIYAGETLLIRTAYTPTALPSITPTPRQPTRTPVPAQAIETLQPVQPTEEPASAPSFLAGLDRTTTGLLLVLLSGIGLVLIIMGTLRRKR